MGVVALFVVQQNIPALETAKVPPGFLRRFDWMGVGLLGGAMVSLLFFTSSRPITGVEGLRDWRLLALCLLLFVAFIAW